MILFPQCKINLGLYIERRRPDGYHDIATIMVPVAWSDILEIVPARSSDTTLTCFGRKVDCAPEQNLVMKAYRTLCNTLGGLPPVDIFLEKIVPDGAGLGGGSADAAATLLILNDIFNLGLQMDRLAEIASLIGADCPLFIYKQPMIATGTGTDLTPVEVNLQGYTLLIAKPQGCAISTTQAYAGITPSGPAPDLAAILRQPLDSWQRKLINEFEPSVFKHSPKIGHVKQTMLDNGARYSAMSGSGAAVFGLFDDSTAAKQVMKLLADCDTYLCDL